MQFNNTESGLYSFKCPLDFSISTVIIFQENPNYNNAKEIFERQKTIAFVSGKLIIVDGEATKEERFSEDHLLVIMAHELGHLKMKHNPTFAKRKEKQADIIGLSLLEKFAGKESNAVKLYKQEYNMRYHSPQNEAIKMAQQIIIKEIQTRGNS